MNWLLIVLGLAIYFAGITQPTWREFFRRPAPKGMHYVMVSDDEKCLTVSKGFTVEMAKLKGFTLADTGEEAAILIIKKIDTISSPDKKGGDA